MPYVGQKPADIISTAVDTVTGTFSGEVDAASLALSADASVGDDLSLVSDGSIVNFGVNSEISLTHVHNSGLTLASSVGATTFKIGRAGATDAKVIFDGNAQDYHIGVDDTNDSLVIGLGGTLGTTDSMVIDAAGHITKPLQPCFYAHKNGTDQNNIATGGAAVTWSTERFDLNNNFDLSNDRFVAPVTGKYFFQVNIRIDSVDTAAGYYIIQLITTLKSYQFIIDPNFSADLNYMTAAVTVLADMDASDTASVIFDQNGGTAQSDIDGNTDYTWFSGYLVA